MNSAWHNQPEALLLLAQRVGESGRVLDIGTGTGHTAFAFARTAGEVVALDLTPQMLAIVDREAKRLGLGNVTSCLGDAEALPFEDGSFDLVVTRVAAHHFKNPAKFIAEVERVLVPEGRFLFIDTVGPEEDHARRLVDQVETLRDPSHEHDLSISEWCALAKRFQIEWQELVKKPLHLEDWMTRMNVVEGSKPEIRTMILESEGVLRDYLAPKMIDDAMHFHLDEWTCLFRL